MKALIALIAIALVVVLLFTKKTAKDKDDEQVEAEDAQEAPKKRKLLLTNREQAMHNRLTQSLPEMIVLAQVSFGALLQAQQRKTRNRFDRKIADFVVCDKAFRVICAIELDDSSHKGKEEQDAARDEMLKNAGYRVLRYPNIPDIDKVRSDVMHLASEMSVPST